ncbi:MAG: Lrp/AsnC family transcriptional regulator [Rhodospirillales bacterium]|nr:Lrp/AsnC family transcriptional regulator [Rhodospirillales bacterium]MCB9973025.1 Lrp/AsnC family transcriptional regulator [Rhodospirillales bacterium]
MRRQKLDKTDLKILKKLQENGRATNVELAEYAGISAPPCLRRVRGLEEANIIRGYNADINPGSLGYGIQVMTQVKLESNRDLDIRKFELQIQEWDCVRECYLLSGDIDYLLKIVAKDWDSYQHFLTTQLAAMNNVASVKTSPIVRTAKALRGVPIEV